MDRRRATSSLLLLPIIARADTDEDLRRRLVGRWSEERNAGCTRYRQQVKLEADGRFEVNGLTDDCGKVTLFTWRGTWYVKGFRFGYVTVDSSEPERFRPGAVLEDEIVSVTDTEWVMLEQSTGARSVARRER
jgi:hypothetical protein